MDRQTYDRYLACFNARDYEGVLAFYADTFDLSFAGYHFKTKAEVRRFYQFFHAYVNEAITVTAYVSNETMAALEANVRLEARKELTAAALEAAGYDRLVALQAGQVIEMPQYIHYHLRDGKIVSVGCAVL